MCADNDDTSEQWNQSDQDSDFEYNMDAAPKMPSFENKSVDQEHADSIVLWLAGFLLSFQAKFHLPDSAIDLLIKFWYAVFQIVCRLSRSSLLEALTKMLPSSLHAMRRYMNLGDTFTRFVVCPKCCEVYIYENCVYSVGQHKLSKDCASVKYPDHPQLAHRQPCGCLLLKSVEFASGKKILYPFKVYAYRSLQKSLQSLLLNSNFYSTCQEWQTRSPCTFLEDIYDGKIWKEHQQCLGSPFLSEPYTFAFVLNVDWFQPYTQIYLTVLNLPRTVRYKRENVIIIGIIPGPHEPKHNINSFLRPLVDELLQFWKGIKLSIQTDSCCKEEVVRCAILCVSCDIPAGRKTCGFLGHTANLGCSRCLKYFPGEVGSKDYSGFDRSEWEKRNNEQHRKAVQQVRQNSRTKTRQKELESLLGCRYSCLLDLPYFDAPRMLCIDPMHNLFLGTGKHMLSLWIKENLLSTEHFETIQNFVDSMHVPPDIGRIPAKIGSGFSGFKADQFKNWIIIYSIPALYNILPSEHLECWRHFVLACRILCKQYLSCDDVCVADVLLISFCRKIEQLYGSSVITPNMHLHGHLKDVILDFGPVQEFWAFSFERYNGILGKQPTNNRIIEPQLMNCFLRDTSALSFPLPQQFKEEFSPLTVSNQLVGSVSETLNVSKFTLPSKSTKGIFDSECLQFLNELYCKMHPTISNYSVIINTIFKKFKSITLRGKAFSSSGQRKNTPYIVMAEWKEILYGKQPTTFPNYNLETTSNVRPVDVHFYVEASVLVDGVLSVLLLAHVSWLFPHPDRYTIGKPAQLWCRRKFEQVGIHSFVPLQQLLCRCAHGMVVHNDENLSVIIPLVE